MQDDKLKYNHKKIRACALKINKNHTKNFSVFFRKRKKIFIHFFVHVFLAFLEYWVFYFVLYAAIKQKNFSLCFLHFLMPYGFLYILRQCNCRQIGNGIIFWENTIADYKHFLCSFLLFVNPFSGILEDSISLC